MSIYLNTALAICRITRTAPSYLLHPLDFLDYRHAPKLSFFPGMKLNRNIKNEIFKYVMGKINRHFTMVNMSTYAKSIVDQNVLKDEKNYTGVKFKQIM